MTTLVELCAGTASVSLWALGRCAPLTGYMGSKRRWAPLLASLLCGERRPNRVVLVDAGPWGDVWRTLAAGGAEATARVVDRWANLPPEGLWEALAGMPPAPDPHERAAQYLWLQARSAGTIPIWWDGRRWTSPTGSRTEDAHERGGRRLGPAHVGHRPSCSPAAACQTGNTTRGTRQGGAAQKTTPNRSRGLCRPSTLAARLRALPDLSCVEVIHGDLRAVEPITGAAVYFDPPYLHCPRYAALCPRADVEATALRWAAAGARVLVSEAEPLLGWPSTVLPGAKKPEVLSASWTLPAAAMCGPLFGLVQEQLGHATMEMTMRYAHLAPGAARSFVAALDGLATPSATPSCGTIQSRRPKQIEEVEAAGVEPAERKRRW